MTTTHVIKAMTRTRKPLAVAEFVAVPVSFSAQGVALFAIGRAAAIRSETMGNSTEA